MSLNTQHQYRYRLLALLGQTAVGEIYLAEDRHHGRQVVMKVIRSDFLARFDPHAVNKAFLLFQHETQALAQLHHPGILPLLESGQVIIKGTPSICFVMPLCPEGSLATWLHERGNPPRLSLHEVNSILSQVAQALQHAHHQHIFHLHIKPENVLIRSRSDWHPPDLCLADFGMATLFSSIPALRQHAPGSGMYMAPEQWEGYPVAATDQYALAVMVYQLLAGRPPYLGSQEQLIYQHMHAQPQPPSCFNPQIPAAIDALVLRALAKRPEERFDSIFAFAHAYDQGLSSTVSSSDAPQHSPAPSATMIPASKSQSRHQVSRARTVGIGLLLLALLLLVGGIGTSIVQSRWGTTPQTAPVAEETTIATAATATATTRETNPNPYPPYTGTLIVDDPMTSDRFNWTVGGTNDATCTFTSSAYQVVGKKKGSVNPCLGSGILFSNYSNFVFEVHMTIISGTGGGLRFHISSAGSDDFVVYQDGHVELLTNDNSGDYRSTLLHTTAGSITKAGGKQTITIAVVASGKQIGLYANNVRIGGTHESFSSQGSFGLIANQESQVAYSDARLWTW